MADLYEVLLVDGGTRWHAGWLVDDDSETDVLLRDHGKVPVFSSRAGLEHHAQQHGLEVQEDLPDEVDLEDDVLESYEEHHVADVLVMELDAMDPSHERFEAKATVLIENVTHHIEEEEQDWFPKVRAGLSRTELRDIGEELAAAREKAPRRPEQPSALKKTVDAVIS